MDWNSSRRVRLLNLYFPVKSSHADIKWILWFQNQGPGIFRGGHSPNLESSVISEIPSVEIKFIKYKTFPWYALCSGGSSQCHSWWSHADHRTTILPPSFWWVMRRKPCHSPGNSAVPMSCLIVTGSSDGTSFSTWLVVFSPEPRFFNSYSFFMLSPGRCETPSMEIAWAVAILLLIDNDGFQFYYERSQEGSGEPRFPMFSKESFIRATFLVYISWNFCSTQILLLFICSHESPFWTACRKSRRLTARVVLVIKLRIQARATRQAECLTAIPAQRQQSAGSNCSRLNCLWGMIQILVKIQCFPNLS